MTESLLDPAFLRRLARLRLLARRRFVGSAGGARRSTRRGSSAEFADHRPYYAGDDVRRIDWNAYARLEELVLRLYVAEEDLCVYLLLDASRSLAFGTPSKLETAKRIAAALGYIALHGGERVSVVPFTSAAEKPLPAARGSRNVAQLLRFLQSIEPHGETDLARTVDTFLSRSPRPGLVVVLSDLLDPAGFSRPLDRLLGEKHEPVVFHVLDRDELDPPSGGDFVLVDSERGGRVEVSLDGRALAAYRARLEAFLEQTRSYCKKRGLAYVPVFGATSFEDALVAYLRQG